MSDWERELAARLIDQGTVTVTPRMLRCTIESAVHMAILETREVCAKIAERFDGHPPEASPGELDAVAIAIAAAIRAEGARHHA